MSKKKKKPTAAPAKSGQRENIKAKPQKPRGGFFLNSTKVWELVLKCILILVIPYVYLLLCGLVFDKLLMLYGMAPFIFYSLIVLYAAAIALVVVAIIMFIRRVRRKK